MNFRHSWDFMAGGNVEFWTRDLISCYFGRAN